MNAPKYEGRPCRAGHTERYVHGGQCVKCCLERASARYRARRGQVGKSGARPKLTSAAKLAIRETVASWAGKKCDLWRVLANTHGVSVNTIIRAAK